MSLLNPKRECKECGKATDQLTITYNNGRCDECAARKEDKNGLR